MTNRFLNFLPFILRWETEFNKDGSVRVERDPDDPGGTTKFGIDQRSHPGIDIAKLTQQRAIEIYDQEWRRAEIDAMAAKFGEVYFNARVNCGPGRAHKLLLKAGHNAVAFLREQAEFYKRLVATKPSSQKYLRGWLNRLDALRAFLRL